MKKNINKGVAFFSVVVILITNYHYILYAYNSLTIDSKIEILPTNKNDGNTYSASLDQTPLKGKTNLVLFNNGWTKEGIAELNHSKIYEKSNEKGWNLIYLSNEYGDHKYNRSRANWLNNICKYKMYGYHIYAPDTFDEWQKYFAVKKKNNTTSHKIPIGFIMNKRGDIYDTIYNLTEFNNLEIIK